MLFIQVAAGIVVFLVGVLVIALAVSTIDERRK